MAKVSIIVPVYNVEKYLERCISSLINQTFDDIEIILINDGSTDSSKDIIEKYSRQDNRIKVIEEANLGSAAARNAGLDRITSKFVMFLDGDDYYENVCIEEAYKKITKEHADIAIFGSKHFDSKGRLVKEILPSSSNNLRIIDHPKILTKIENCTWDKIYKASLFEKEKIKYPEGLYYQDFGITFLLFAEATTVTFLNKELVNYTVGRANSETDEISNRLYDIFKICDLIIKCYKEKGIFEKYYEELKTICTINIIDKLKMALKSEKKLFIKEFSNKSFDYLNSNFKDYKKNKYPVYQTKMDFIYFNPFLFKVYLLFKKGIIL